jgi:2-methylisocitrate lyase-like PEP mutase family enzyme
MTTVYERLFDLQRGPTPLLLPNPWDAGSARLFAALGFQALATTSSGFAATLGRLDGKVTRDEALAHAAVVAGATDLPVNGDFEHGFADSPDDVATTIGLALETGIAGCSIEDFAPRGELYDLGLARERVAAAADVAHRGPTKLVLTGRAENFLRGNPDLADTIARLQAYQAAGADCVYAPGVSAAADIRSIVESVDVPVNVLAFPGVPTVKELGDLGVGRVSIGGAFAYAAINGAAEAAREFLEHGTYNFWQQAGPGSQAAKTAFKD